MDAGDGETFYMCDKIIWAPIVQVVILSAGTLVTFLTAFGYGHVSAYLPFISETGAEVPESCIFTLVLILGSTAGAVVVIHQYLLVRSSLLNHSPRISAINKVSAVCGLVSMFGGAGVAAFPMTTVLLVHLGFAGIHFFCAMGYMISQTFLSFYLNRTDLLWNRLRAILCVLVLIFLVLLVILFPIAQHKWKKTNKHLPAVKTPNDLVFGLMFSSCLMEWLLYGTFLLFISTLHRDFRNSQLKISTVPIAGREQEYTTKFS